MWLNCEPSPRVGPRSFGADASSGGVLTGDTGGQYTGHKISTQTQRRYARVPVSASSEPSLSNTQPTRKRIFVLAMLCAAQGLFARSAAAEPTATSAAENQRSTRVNSGAKPLTIDLTGSLPPVTRGHLGLGTTCRPDGETVDADSRCCYRNGRPWIPVWGEFHSAAIPARNGGTSF